MEMTSQHPRSRNGLLGWMIVSQRLMLGSLVIWLLVAGLSVMAFDSGVTAEAWRIVGVAWAYPILPAGLVVAAWISYARHRDFLAALLSGLSFMPPLILYVGIWISSLAWSAR